MGFPWNFVTVIGLEETRMMPLADGGKSLETRAFV